MEVRVNVMEFAAAILTLSTKYTFSVSSWGRTVARNKAVGGVEGSYHLLWLGVDIFFDGKTLKNVQFEADASRIGLVALHEGDHYHLQPKAV